MPASASCSPIHAELLSTMMPSSSSVPMAMTSQRIPDPRSKSFRWSGGVRPYARAPTSGAGGARGSDPVAPYLIGENGAASTILFSCLRAGLPPGGGQMPSATAFLRTSARWSRLL